MMCCSSRASAYLPFKFSVTLQAVANVIASTVLHHVRLPFIRGLPEHCTACVGDRDSCSRRWILALEAAVLCLPVRRSGSQFIVGCPCQLRRGSGEVDHTSAIHIYGSGRLFDDASGSRTFLISITTAISAAGNSDVATYCTSRRVKQRRGNRRLVGRICTV